MKPITSITIFHSVTRSFIQFGFQLFSGVFFFIETVHEDALLLSFHTILSVH